MAILPRKIFSHMWFGFKPEINYYKSFIFLLCFFFFFGYSIMKTKYLNLVIYFYSDFYLFLKLKGDPPFPPLSLVATETPPKSLFLL